MVLLVLQTFALFYTLENVGAMDIHRPSERMMFGAKADIKDFPYFASLPGCGGSIISESWVVTAAHCVRSLPSILNFVWVGSPLLSTGKRVSYDKIVYYDPTFNEFESFDILSFDIVLLHLSKPLKFSDTIQPVQLPSFEDLTRSGADSMLVFVAHEHNKDLEKTDVVRLSTEECLSYLPSHIKEDIDIVGILEKEFICARRADGRPGPCPGDSGSPLTDGNTLVGMASFVQSPCWEAQLGFYVNVTSYVPWIKSVAGLE